MIKIAYLIWRCPQSVLLKLKGKIGESLRWLIRRRNNSSCNTELRIISYVKKTVEQDV